MINRAACVGLIWLVGCGGKGTSGSSAYVDGPATDIEDLEGASCTEDTAPEAVTQRVASVSVDGVTRRFRVTIPSVEPGTTMPVILAFHGGGGSGFPFEQQDQFDALGAQEDFIMIYPQGQVFGDNEGEWQLNTGPDSGQDIAFVEAILDGLDERYCIDTSRIYGVGYSLGGMFVYELACHLNTRFAGIVSLAGTMPVSPNTCADDPPVGLLHVHGREDSIIPYASQWDWKAWDEVGMMQDIPSLIEYWSEHYSCEASEVTEPASDLSRTVHSDCDGDVRVEHIRRNDGDHEWPSSIDGVSTPTMFWQFLSQFSRS